jgi:hypothetical protein
MLMQWADWFFRDRRSGRIVVGQWPNLALWLFLAGRLLAELADEPIRHWAWLLSEGALVWWAADELARGVNPWRRCLGVGVLIWLAYGLTTRIVT